MDVFIASGDPELLMPTSLTSFERRAAHKAAEEADLLHLSEGEGATRRIRIWKKEEMIAAEAATAAAAAQEGGGGGEGADAESAEGGAAAASLATTKKEADNSPMAIKARQEAFKRRLQKFVKAKEDKEVTAEI
tara:strand:- start:162 stop:563 length:402 start_codon:yes stop_codon:yes gene_type:complete